MNPKRSTLLKRCLRLLFPEAFFDEMTSRTLTGKDFFRLFTGNLILFLILSLLTILYQLFLSRSFQPVYIPAYLGSDILLALIFAFASYRWILFRQRDKKHFSRYSNHDLP